MSPPAWLHSAVPPPPASVACARYWIPSTPSNLPIIPQTLDPRPETLCHKCRFLNLDGKKGRGFGILYGTVRLLAQGKTDDVIPVFSGSRIRDSTICNGWSSHTSEMVRTCPKKTGIHSVTEAPHFDSWIPVFIFTIPIVKIKPEWRATGVHFHAVIKCYLRFRRKI